MTYGLFSVRSVGHALLKMVLDDTGCHVQLLHEGGSLLFGQAIELVAELV